MDYPDDRIQRTGKIAKLQYIEELTKLLDPKKPQQFWNVINKNHTNESKPNVQSIKRIDGSHTITEQEIIHEMKQQYGKENLEIKHTQTEWYNEVENCVSDVINITNNSLKHTKIEEDFENQDLYLEKVCAAIEKIAFLQHQAQRRRFLQS